MKLKQKALAILAALALAITGLAGITAVSAPAQASVGSNVWYISKEPTVSSDFRVIMHKMGGGTVRMTPGNTLVNSYKICPSNLTGRLKVRTPAGGITIYGYSVCAITSAIGTYSVTAVD